MRAASIALGLLLIQFQLEILNALDCQSEQEFEQDA
jgi:hypothetical protein